MLDPESCNLILFAHSETGQGWSGPLEPWEFHPMVVHFPIAFLIGGVLVGLYAWWRGRLDLDRVACGLLIAGVLSGVVAALSGVLAIYTIPASHTEEAHGLMQWHLWLQLVSLAMFGCAAWLSWRNCATLPSLAVRMVGWIAALVLIVGSGIGGYLVYHGGAGIDARLMKVGLHNNHHKNHDKH